MELFKQFNMTNNRDGEDEKKEEEMKE